MVKKGKVAEAMTEIPSEPQPVEAPSEVDVPSMETEQTQIASGKDKCRFAETRNVAVHDRPTSSPYTTRPYTLLIGASRVQYTILEDYLRFVPKWAEKCNFHSKPLPVIDLTADVHEDASHTLVHYLNTGTYQTLKLPGISGIGQKLADYKTNVLAYCVARIHGLPGLETLAKLHVTSSGTVLPFFDLLDITAAIYNELPAGEQWFVTFLKSTIDAAYKSDRDLFKKDAFLNRIGENRSFNLVLVNSIVRNLAESNETASKHSGSGSRQNSRGSIKASDSNRTTVELVVPIAAEIDLTTAKAKLSSRKKARSAAYEAIFGKEEPVVAEEDSLFTNWRSSALELRGRSPGPRTSSYQSEGIAHGESAHTQPAKAISNEVKKYDKLPISSPTPAPLPSYFDHETLYTPEPLTEDLPIPKKTNKKKSTKDTLPVPVVEEDIFVAKKTDKKKSKKSSPPVQPLESCPVSNEHLQTEGWKDCVLCRARVKQLGTQLKKDEALKDTF
ncbi:hypothetical protein MMC26_002505 [Xylographa opegraphella]|nr:hypothetical protein [Xylographa opegraphella]